MQKMKEQDEMYEEKLSEYESVKSALIICNVSEIKMGQSRKLWAMPSSRAPAQIQIVWKRKRPSPRICHRQTTGISERMDRDDKCSISGCRMAACIP